MPQPVPPITPTGQPPGQPVRPSIPENARPITIDFREGGNAVTVTAHEVPASEGDALANSGQFVELTWLSRENSQIGGQPVRVFVPKATHDAYQAGLASYILSQPPSAQPGEDLGRVVRGGRPERPGHPAGADTGPTQGIALFSGPQGSARLDAAEVSLQPTSSHPIRVSIGAYGAQIRKSFGLPEGAREIFVPQPTLQRLMAAGFVESYRTGIEGAQVQSHRFK